MSWLTTPLVSHLNIEINSIPWCTINCSHALCVKESRATYLKSWPQCILNLKVMYARAPALFRTHLLVASALDKATCARRLFLVYTYKWSVFIYSTKVRYWNICNKRYPWHILYTFCWWYCKLCRYCCKSSVADTCYCRILYLNKHEFKSKKPWGI